MQGQPNLLQVLLAATQLSRITAIHDHGEEEQGGRHQDSASNDNIENRPLGSSLGRTGQLHAGITTACRPVTASGCRRSAACLLVNGLGDKIKCTILKIGWRLVMSTGFQRL